VISISRPRACTSRRVGGIREITGAQENPGDLAWQSFCTTPPVHLSPRETEILRYIAAGHTTKELAAALNIAESTAEWHISNILAELGAASRAEAVAIALREGLLAPKEQPLTGKSAPDLATKRTHRARAWRDNRVIHFDLLGLHLGEIRIGRGRRDLAQTETKPLGAESGEARGHDAAKKGEQ
jgi:DNA-binding CsgD family transcriptional regulator